ncbi:MAG: diguanylate cyclase [Planctomycetes bacterium]|nr:diguanylate cyclase [Planctomycetota bacterium]
MLPILGVSVSYLLIDMALALVALTVGFLAALWYVRNVSGASQNDTDSSGADSPEVVLEKEAAANDAERASMAAMQLQDLAKNVATDVGAHNAVIAGISGNLCDVKTGADDLNKTVMDAVAQIMAANDKLQSRLTDAEQKIQTQAEELSTQQSEARTDVLTKLPNRRAFDDAMNAGSQSSDNQEGPFSLMIFDVDHFKKFNDTHGHQAGDEVLRQVGKTMVDVVKNSDLPCRYGGEEFAVVMPNTDIVQARVAAERMRKAIEAMKVNFEGSNLKVAASIGVAEIEPKEESASLMRRADDAVYAAKAGGRNRSYWHDGDQCRAIDDTASTKAATPTPATTSAEPATKAAATEAPSENVEKSTLLKDLPDRAVFSGELHRRINESHRFGVSLSIMHLSVKGYAGLEQEYGDAVGKLLLDTVAQFIRSRLREMDLLGKLDDGEFVVMLPGSSEREALLVGNRVQSAIANCVIPLGDKQLRLDLEQGVTEVQPDDEAPTMLARAKATANLQVEETVGAS